MWFYRVTRFSLLYVKEQLMSTVRKSRSLGKGNRSVSVTSVLYILLHSVKKRKVLVENTFGKSLGSLKMTSILRKDACATQAGGPLGWTHRKLRQLDHKFCDSNTWEFEMSRGSKNINLYKSIVIVSKCNRSKRL